MTVLDELEPVWRTVFDLMWEAYVAGTIPVGAIVVDDAGRVVARGRNRIFDSPGDGQLGASRLAHAEVNALLRLGSERTYEAFALYTALEPCHLCLAGAISVRVGTVRYAGADPYGGAVGRLEPSQDHRAHPIAVEGPLTGPAGLLPELLHVAHFLWRRPEGDVAGFYRETRPDLVRAAGILPPPDGEATLAEAFAALERL